MNQPTFQDWALFLSTLLGAVLSFVFIMLSNFIARRIAANNLTTKIRKELKENRDELEKLIDKPENEVKFVSPLWDIVKISSALLDFNTKTYLKIVHVYTAIKQLNELESSINKLNKDSRETIIGKRKETLRLINDNMV
jgi:hypothetical protein